jgi:hypothetical protein
MGPDLTMDLREFDQQVAVPPLILQFAGRKAPERSGSSTRRDGFGF